MDVSKLGALFPNPIKAQESSSMVLTILTIMITRLTLVVTGSLQTDGGCCG